jgi:hypothetical protein
VVLAGALLCWLGGQQQQQHHTQGIVVMTYTLCGVKRCQGLHDACSSCDGVVYWRMHELCLLVQASNPAASKHQACVSVHVYSQLHNVTSFYWCCCVGWAFRFRFQVCSS